MTKSNIITISGALGSGKSTIMKLLATDLGYDTYSTGAAQRKIALKYGVTTLQLNHMADSNPAIDQEIDGVFRDLKNSGKDYIVDSRMAFYFLPDSFKVKLNVAINEAARRVYNDKTRTSEVKFETLEDAKAALIARRASEVARFMGTYGVNIDDEKNFDLVVDTTDKTPKQICSHIINAFKKSKYYHDAHVKP